MAESTKQSHSEWEEEVITHIEEAYETTRSDAQGIIDSRAFTLAQCWSKGMSSKETADKLLSVGADIK